MVEVPASVGQGGEPGLAQATLGTVDLVSWLHPTHLLGEEEALVPVGPVGRLAVGVPVAPVSEGRSTSELIRPEEPSWPSYTTWRPIPPVSQVAPAGLEVAEVLPVVPGVPAARGVVVTPGQRSHHTLTSCSTPQPCPAPH